MARAASRTTGSCPTCSWSRIDLLPEAQGQGAGRALMRELGLAALAASVPGIHLVMSSENIAARAFYDRLGFSPLAVDGDAVVLGIDPRRLV